jgi:nucleotide-binding universal stress UspA family protein
MYKKIMVPVDGSKLAECVLPHVESVVKGCNSPNIVFVRVIEPTLEPYGASTDGAVIISEKDAEILRRERDKQQKIEAEKYLDLLTSQLKYETASIQAVVIAGKPADSLADYARENSIDLIIMSTHGHSGISRWVWGSTADRVLRSSCVPVMMIRAPGCVPGI